jgi:menaquinone-dependent protoporphyrinogen oxidase
MSADGLGVEQEVHAMRVLVTAASKHGSSAEIARTVGIVLQQAGIDVAVLAPEDVPSLEGYDAVVLGSGIYAGRWLDGAKRFIERNREALLTRRVWLFSSGPIGDPPKPEGVPADAATIVQTTGARGHKVFAGRLTKEDLSFGEKVIAAAVKAPDGDFRRWDEVRAWAASIATELHPGSVPTPVG